MKTFEISSRNTKHGRRHFKVILHEIYPDSCVDEKTGETTEYNLNGITWIRQYCEEALESIKGMSLRCEFLDEDRTELCGHGETEIKDGLPLFENATMIGTFDKGYIEDIPTEDGIKTVCIGEGTIDGLCYEKFVKKLGKDIKEGHAPFGSVEILKQGDNPGIVYKYGYKDQGRIPMIFDYSGYALLGVKPADDTAKILELNNSDKGENCLMDENMIKTLVAEVIDELSNSNAQINALKEECAQKIAEMEALVAEKESAIEELNATITAMKDELSAANEAKETCAAEKDALSQEINSLNEQLDEAKKAEKMSELNNAIADFSDEEKAYAKEEIEAFTAAPLTSEINTVVNKIYAEIGKNAKAVPAEEKHEDNDIEDIFSEVCQSKDEEEIDIF